MSSKIYIKQNVDAAVEFWGASDFHATKTADAPKLRLMEVHPTKSLIVAADRDGKVMLWDYEQHQTIMNTTCALLVLEKSNVSNDKSSPAPSSTGLHGRLTARSNNRLTGSITNKPSIASTLAYRSTGTLHSNSPSSNYAPVVQNKMKQQLGQVLQVCFADASYKRSCAGPGAYAHRALPSARSSETRITIVCENALIFHDYATKATTALTAAELGRANPTCVEPISTTCLIGCSDGLIRVWDEEHAPEAHQYSASSSGAGPALAPVPAGGIALTLNTHSKCEVTAIKAVPIRNPSEAEVVEQHKLRFVSVAADGQCLVWELLAAQIGASSALPLARIKESLGAGITRADLNFDPESNALLVCTNERKIRMWDFEDLSAMSTLSGSMHNDGGGVSSSVHGSISSSVHGSISSSVHGGGFLGSSTHGGGFLGSSTHGGSKGGIRSSLGLGKRGGLSAIIGGGADPLAAVFSLKSVGAVQPEKGLSAYGKIASFGLVQHPYFSTGTYMLTSKGNTFAILQDKDSSGGGMDEESSSQSASAVGAAPDKTAPLYLIQEFSLHSLMERYLAVISTATDTTLLPSVGDALRMDALDAAAKVYSVRPHPYQPNLVTILTSVGVLVLSLGRLPAGSAYGVHPSWGAIKLVQTTDAMVHKILCALPASDASEAAAGQAVEICPEILEECGALEHTSAGNARQSMSSAASLRRRPSSKRSTATGGSGLDSARSSCRPVFHPSPSGTYCAVHWPESTVYVVIQVGAAVVAPTSPAGAFDAFGTGSKPQSTSTTPVVEVDRGHCVEFGWVGTDDSYLIKTPPTVNSASGAQKNKRASVSNLIFGTQKATSLLFPSQLILKSCVADASGVKVTEQALQLSQLGVAKGGNTGTPLIQPALVVNIFGGPVLNMNTLNAKESEALLTAAAQAKRAQDAAAAAAVDPKRQGPAGVPAPSTADTEQEEGPKVIEDVDATVRELRAVTPPAASKQISTFFTVVSGKWLRLRQAQEAAAAASALAAKDKGKKPRRTSVMGGGNDAAADEDKPEALDSTLHLVAVGSSMQRVEAVRWDFTRNQCAILQTGSSAVTIMRLHTPAVTAEDNGYAQLSLLALCTVDVCFPTSLRPPVCGLTWSEGMLFTTSTGASTIKLTFFSTPTSAVSGEKAPAIFADTFELPNCSPYYSGRSAKGVLDNPFSCGAPPSPLATTEALGLHEGVVYTCTRDGTVYGVPVAANKVLPSLLQGPGSVEISRSLTSVQREAALAVLLHRGVKYDVRTMTVDADSDLQVCVEEMKFTDQQISHSFQQQVYDHILTMNQCILFEDIFEIKALNENGKKFERVNRLHCKGTTFDVDFVVDVNSELFDVKAGDRIAVVLASSVTGAADDGNYNPNYGHNSLLDNYEYVMHGRVFSIKHIEKQNVEVQASFGGLLCRLRGEQAHVESLVVDMTFFLLMRKGGSVAMDI